jgi:hypothetical protein
MTDKNVRRCSDCGSTTLRFDPPISIEPQEACGAMKPGTYTGYEKGGIPVCMKPRHPSDVDHGFLGEYWDTWHD